MSVSPKTAENALLSLNPQGEEAISSVVRVQDYSRVACPISDVLSKTSVVNRGYDWL